MKSATSVAAVSPLARLPFFYGWVVVGVAFVTMAIALTARTGFSLLFPELIAEFGWDRGVTAGAFSLGFVASTAFVPLVGALMDRVGPRLVIPLGALLVGGGYLLAPAITTPLGLYLTLGLLVVCGSMATSYIVHAMFVTNWFVRRRGLATGLAFAGVGVGGMVLFPLMQGLIATSGWRSACVLIGVVVLVVLVPLNMALQRQRPADLGLLPDGDGRVGDGAGGDGQAGGAPARPPAADPVVDRAWADTDWTLALAVRTARFWWVLVAFFGGLFVWYAVQVHQTKFLLEAGFPPALAAAALGLVGLCGIAGQIGIGALSDRVGREAGWTLAMIGYMICAAVLLVLDVAPSTPLVYLMVAAQGLLGYGLASIFGAIPAELFGGRRFATIFGVLALGGNLGGGAGPWLLGLIYDLTGRYTIGFWICLAMALLSVVAMWLAAPRQVRLVAGQARKRAARLATG